ncbi:zinc-dependent alcohol dehydrogenase [Gephyromycinifex aptenodytis]|uniref:zinc-dependent alcohol dehydrogenase n=1 Tax=Gephyromycinifex aptenodytis TaxID=2716227 RepID=UPI0014480BCC|nr:zinc-binding alcohol dehydrogenase [Gephyromycinifex aptenodytis]
MESRSYWTTQPGQGEIRTATLDPPGEGQALVRTLFSGISRGTESLVHRGLVPPEVRELMRAPFQQGELPGPVHYGYLSVGVVEQGPAQLQGKRVFCLYPHADCYVVPTSALTLIPDEVPSERAILAGAAETAINALWDAGPRFGDRIAVVGAGMIGGTLAALLRRFPLQRLELIDPDPQRSQLAAALDVAWAPPQEATAGCDLVFHCSAHEEGLARGLELLGDEGELIEMSWYGTAAPRVPLGADFHARRLRIRSSQVGAVSAARRARRTHAERMATAVAALADPTFDALLTGPVPFDELPTVMDAVATGRAAAVCHIVSYP